MMTRHIYLSVVPPWVLAVALVVMWRPETSTVLESSVRLALCAPLALYFPGWMLVDVMRIEGDTVTRVTLSVFLSLAVCIFSGFLLNMTGHLDAQGWVCALGLTTIAVWCLNVLFPSKRPVAKVSWSRPGPRFVIFVMSGILATGSVLMARPSALERKPFDFTELWMVPQWNWTNNVVTIGIRNSEAGNTLYGLDLVLGGTLIAQMPPFELASSTSRTFEFSVPTKTHMPERLEAWLYKDGDRSTIYRKVWMTVNTQQSLALAGNASDR